MPKLYDGKLEIRVSDQRFLNMLETITFGLEFAEDGIIRLHIKNRFYYYLLPYNNLNLVRETLVNKIRVLKDYYAKLYQTTQYEYDPFINFDITEQYTHIGGETEKVDQRNNQNDVGGNTENRNNANKEYGYDGAASPTSTGTNDVYNNGVSSTENVGKQNREKLNKEEYIKRSFGDNSVRSAQYVIEEERRIQLKLIEMYVNEFKGVFILD